MACGTGTGSTGSPLMSCTSEDVIVMNVELADEARCLNPLMSFRSSNTSDTVITVESLAEWRPSVRVNIWYDASDVFLSDTRVMAVTVNVLASTVSSNVSVSISDVRLSSNEMSVGRVVSGKKMLTGRADSVSIATTGLSFMSRMVSSSKAR